MVQCNVAVDNWCPHLIIKEDVEQVLPSASSSRQQSNFSPTLMPSLLSRMRAALPVELAVRCSRHFIERPPPAEAPKVSTIDHLLRGQQVNFAPWAGTQSNTGLSKAGRGECRADISPNLFQVWVKYGRKPQQARPRSKEVQFRPVICWCARRDLNPRPIDP